MNAQKTITMDFDEYQAELSNAQKEGYYRAIRAKVEEKPALPKDNKRSN